MGVIAVCIHENGFKKGV